ncbi:MAG TPA: trehalase family glycosidase, partial [Novosphingobium sp.]|nr:trehalase family glycosidase [Novosphingobium sp.]
MHKMTNAGSMRARSLQAGLAAVLLLTGLAANTPPAAAEQPAPVQTPADRFGDLFVAVQEGRIFADGKTFVDAVPKRDPAAIMADYRAAAHRSREALTAFVLANFTVPGVNDRALDPLRDHVRALWPQLVRQPARTTDNGSGIALSKPYVVPGGRFREIYY